MKPKTLFILHYPPPIHGASMVGKFIKESKIINASFRVKYIHLGVTKAFKERKKVTFRKVTYFFGLLLKCIRINASYKPKLIYMTLTSNGMGMFKDAVIIFFLKFRKVQMVYHFHNKGVEKKQNKFLYNIANNYIFKNAKVILLSERLFSDIEKYVDFKDVFVCPNGIPELGYDLIETTKQEVRNPKVPQILFLSNLIKSKGVYTLLEACNILLKKSVGFNCTFVGGEGDTTAEQFADEVKKLELNDNVKYFGKKYGEEKDEIFKRADIFAFPTYYPNECFPLVLLEAMQYGLPIITTSEGGIEDIVEDLKNGLIAKKNNPEDLARKLEALIASHSLRQEMGRSNIEKFKKKYTLNIFENNLSNILKTILNNNEG